jgi:arylsulfatase A-like enzyme
VKPSAGRIAAAAVVLFSLAAGALFLRSRGSSPSRPSIVLVVWDTCRGDRVSVNGYAHPTTPRLAEMAARGTTFRRCYTPSPWTPPAHASLFTGLLPRTHGLLQGMGDRVRPGIPLLAETLRGAGYETVCVVANPVLSDVTGLDGGFEFDFHCFQSERGEFSDALRDQVKRWGDRRRSTRGDRRPVFLFVNLMDTHLPYVFDAAAVAAVRGEAAVEGARRAAAAVGDMDGKAHMLGQRRIPEETIRGLDAAYDGAIRRDDRNTGEILDYLRAEGLLEGAFTAVCSDHGENLGEHGELYHVLSVYEPVLHVPLVVSWPGRFEGGRVVDEEVRLQDLYPTILEAAGVPVPAPCGRDAVSLTASPLLPRTLVADFGPIPLALPAAREALPDAPPSVFDRFLWTYRAVREPASVPGARKLVAITRTGEGGDPAPVREELYDLAADPGETRNLLAPGGPADARAAAARLRAMGEKGR